MRLYDHPASANCMKCRVLLRLLDIPFELVTVDLFRRETRTPEHLERNPDGRVPVLELDGGETIPESGAIMLYLADDTPLLPAGRLDRARVHQWLFFEQNQIESQLAVARFLIGTGRADKHRALVDSLVARGRGSMGSLARGLADGRPFLTGDDLTIADVALHAYVHCAGDAGVDPREYGGVGAWLDRVEAVPGFVADLAPFPPHAIAGGT
jgi:glutathione S-transferase